MQSNSSKLDLVPENNDQGVTIYADAKIAVRGDVKIEGVGTADFSIVAAGAIAVDVISVVGAKKIESNEKRPRFEYTGVLWTNRQA